MEQADNLTSDCSLDSFFASPARADEKKLKKQLEAAGKNPIINALLGFVSGLVAVLNEDRQILLINPTLLEMLGINNPEKIIGLRPGEALHCIHAHETAAGCGTSRYCSTCGAAIAMVTSLSSGEPREKKCMVTVEKDNKTSDLCFKVRACPIIFENETFILLFLQDISQNERWAALERSFFHDIGNMINILVGYSSLITSEEGRTNKEYIRIMQTTLQNLAREVKIQQLLLQSDIPEYQLSFQALKVRDLLEEILEAMNESRVFSDIKLKLVGDIPETAILTDGSILRRILINMVKNAFEAASEKDEIRLWVKKEDEYIVFSVWNPGSIPENVAKRIFQRYFSTKSGQGRGLGTFSMKLFGEEFLGGKVEFSSNDTDGTIFRFSHPIQPPIKPNE